MRWYFLLVMTLVLVGCGTTPRYKGVAQGDNHDNVLGVTVDERFGVVEVVPDSAAAQAGVQVGDTLVSLTWILSEVPAELSRLADGGSATVATNAVSITVTPMRPPAGVQYETIPFHDGEGIRTLLTYGVPLRLQVVRNGRVLELTVIPAPHAASNDATTIPPYMHF